MPRSKTQGAWPWNAGFQCLRGWILYLQQKNEDIYLYGVRTLREGRSKL